MHSCTAQQLWKYVDISERDWPLATTVCHQPHLQHLVHNGGECKCRIRIERYSPREYPRYRICPEGESNNPFVLATNTLNHIDTCQPYKNKIMQQSLVKYLAWLLSTIRSWVSDWIASSKFPVSGQNLKTLIHHSVMNIVLNRMSRAHFKGPITDWYFFFLYKSLQYNPGDQH